MQPCQNSKGYLFWNGVRGGIRYRPIRGANERRKHRLHDSPHVAMVNAQRVLAQPKDLGLLNPPENFPRGYQQAEVRP